MLAVSLHIIIFSLEFYYLFLYEFPFMSDVLVWEVNKGFLAGFSFNSVVSSGSYHLGTIDVDNMKYV